jgi:hypothetical protein
MSERFTGKGTLLLGDQPLGLVGYTIVVSSTEGTGLLRIDGRIQPLGEPGGVVDLWKPFEQRSRLTLELEDGRHWHLFLKTPKGDAMSASGAGLLKTKIVWTSTPPPDKMEWERVIRNELEDVVGVCDVELSQSGTGWQVASARCGGVAVGMGPVLPTPSWLDTVPHVTKALALAGKRVVGRVRMYEQCPACNQELELEANGTSTPLVFCRNAACPRSETGWPLR